MYSCSILTLTVCLRMRMLCSPVLFKCSCVCARRSCVVFSDEGYFVKLQCCTLLLTENIGCLNSAQIHLCCFIDNRLSVLLLQSISFIPLFPLLPSSASPSMRGSTPLDVAAASVMDNNELALALREPDLEKVRLTFAHTKVYQNIASLEECSIQKYISVD